VINPYIPFPVCVHMYLRALLVGTPRKCMASLHRNSLTEERITARPSPALHTQHHVQYTAQPLHYWQTDNVRSFTTNYISQLLQKHIKKIEQQELIFTSSTVSFLSLSTGVPIFHLFWIKREIVKRLTLVTVLNWEMSLSRHMFKH